MKIIMFSMLLIINTVFVFSQEYTLYYSGEEKGFITIKRESNGKITITPIIITNIILRYEYCPLLPKNYSSYMQVAQLITLITIDGNTSTTTYSDGSWHKTVVDGNTKTETYSNGMWFKTVVDGNTTTETYFNGNWKKTVVDGNTTTVTSSYGSWSKTVVDGNTTTVTYSDGSWYKTVVDKQGYNIYITTERSERD